MTGREWLRALVVRQRNRPPATGGYVSADALPNLTDGGCTFPASRLQPAELPPGTTIQMRDDPPDPERLLAAVAELNRLYGAGSERDWARAHTDIDECLCCAGLYTRCRNPNVRPSNPE